MTKKQLYQIVGWTAAVVLCKVLFFPEAPPAPPRPSAYSIHSFSRPARLRSEMVPMRPVDEEELSSPETTPVEAAPAGSGLTYQHHTSRYGPLSIHVIRVQRGRPDLEVITTLGQGDMIGLATLTQQIRMVPPEAGKPVAAINGGFYRLEGGPHEGDPRGLLVVRGELISAPDEEACFWIDAQGNPQIGEVLSEFSVTWPNGDKTDIGLNEERQGSSAVLYTTAMGATTETRGGVEFILESADPKNWLPLRLGAVFPARIREIRRGGNSPIAPSTLVLSLAGLSQYAGAKAASVGETVTLSTTTQPELKGIRTALGGGPMLVHDSKAQPGRVHKSLERHPRAAVGFTKKEILFVEVDGRQPGLSRGMSLPELAEFMVKQECEEAINLDGGASAELWLKGRIMNRPCFGRERYTANTLLVVQKDNPKKP